MVQQLVATLQSAHSSVRLNRYRPKGSGSDLDMLINYYWNVSLADSLLCPIGSAEIMLRNTIHNSLASHFGTPNWYDQRGLLEHKQQLKLQSAKAHIARSGRTVTPERVISSLTFGFWVILLSRTYDGRFWRANHAAALKQAFPFVPKVHRQRHQIHSSYNAILTLRNNAFHHEPLWDRSTLVTEHAAVYRGIAWIDPGMVAPTQVFDRFPDVYAHGRAAVETTLRAHLGLL
jgi:hypothetical protein